MYTIWRVSWFDYDAALQDQVHQGSGNFHTDHTTKKAAENQIERLRALYMVPKLETLAGIGTPASDDIPW